jgi:addiction module RelE/StbE family toxin
MGHRVSPDAEDDLTSAWRYMATETGAPEIADRLVDAIAERFLAKFPHLGRSRDDDLRPGLRTFVVKDYVIIYRVTADKDVVILGVLHGSRDIEALFND